MKPDLCRMPKHAAAGANLSRPRTIADANQARLADAVDVLSEIDALVAPRLPRAYRLRLARW
jgi:hypothetical protein